MSGSMMHMPVLPGVPSGSQPIVSHTYSSGSMHMPSGSMHMPSDFQTDTITGMNLTDELDGAPI